MRHRNPRFAHPAQSLQSPAQLIKHGRFAVVQFNGAPEARDRLSGLIQFEQRFALIEERGPGIRNQLAGFFEEWQGIPRMAFLYQESSEEIVSLRVLRIILQNRFQFSHGVIRIALADIHLAEFEVAAWELVIEFEHT